MTINKWVYIKSKCICTASNNNKNQQNEEATYRMGEGSAKHVSVKGLNPKYIRNS